MKIDSVTECRYDLISTGLFDYKRKSDGTWTTTYAGIEKEVEDCTELEKAYQEYKNETN